MIVAVCEACGGRGPLRFHLAHRASLCGRCFALPPLAWVEARRQEIDARRAATVKARATRARLAAPAEVR